MGNSNRWCLCRKRDGFVYVNALNERIFQCSGSIENYWKNIRLFRRSFQ